MFTHSLSDYPPGLIGLPCGDIARTSDIVPAMTAMLKPTGTMLKKHGGLGVASPLNQIGRAFMASPRLQWLFLTNDDNLCPVDTIPRLLDHLLEDRADVVTGLYFARIQPFEPVLFDTTLTEGDGKIRYRRRFMQPGDKGLVPILACGDGCLMIRRRVIEDIGYPWWEYGATESDQCDHDIVFSQKVMAAGFKLRADLDVIVDHATSMVVRPVRHEDGTWHTHLVQGKGRSIELPVVTKAGNYTDGRVN